MSTPYDDIIHLPHPTSRKHPRMPQTARAAQFAPFSALTGYEDAVRETARLTDRRIELDEYEKAALDEQLQIIQEHLDEQLEITFTYFVPDEKKSGGAYVDVTGIVKKVDIIRHEVVLMDGTRIPADGIIRINGNGLYLCYDIFR